MWIKQQSGSGSGSSIVVAARDSLSKLKTSADFVCKGTDDQIVIQQAIDKLTQFGGEIFLLDGTYRKSNAEGITLPSNVTIRLSSGAIVRLDDGINQDATIFTNPDKVSGNSNIRILGGKLDCNRQGQTSGYQMAYDFENVSSSEVNSWIQNYTFLEGKEKNSHVKMTNQLFLVPEYRVFDCETVPSTGGGVSVSATLSIDCMVGTHSLNIVDERIYFNQNNIFPDHLYDRPMSFAFWVKFEDVTKVTNFYYGNGYLGSNKVARLFKSNTWYRIVTPAQPYPKESKALYFGITNSQGTSVWIDDIWVIPTSMRPAISIAFDDAIPDRFLGNAEAIAKYNGKAAWPIDVERPELDMDLLNEAYYKYGWDLVSHSYTHQDMDALTQEELLYDLVESKKWLINNGFPRGADYFVYPRHRSNGDTEELVSKVYGHRRYPLVGDQSGLDLWGKRPMYVQENIIAGDTFESNNFIDRIMRNHGWVDFLRHVINDTQVLEDLCSFFAEWGLKLQTPREIMEEFQKEFPNYADISNKPLYNPNLV